MRGKRTIYSIITTVILQIVILIYGFIIPKIIIGTFGSEVNGLISSVTQFLSYITLLELGVGPVMKAALYKPIAQKDTKNIANVLRASEKFFKKIAFIFVIYIILLTILYPLLTNQFDYFYTASLIVIISASIFAEYYFGITYNLYLQANQKTYINSIIQIGVYLLNTVVILLLAKFNVSIHLIKLISGLIFIGRPLLQNFYVKKKYNIDLKNADKNYKLEKKWDGFSQHIASVIHSNTDITIITLFCNLLEVSVYSVYYLIVKGVKSIVQGFYGGIEAFFGDMIAKKDIEGLNKNFNFYETIYFSVITVIFICTIILIVPFVSVYTKGITDVNYIRNTFGVLIVLGEFVWSIRLPYSSTTLAAGHFKETKKGAWVESIVNIVLSIILVIKFGIVGVAIGTLIAMLVRTVEFVYHTNKYILERKIFASVKKIIIIFIETVIVVSIFKILPMPTINSYFDWIIYSIIVFISSSIFVFLINLLCYKEEYKRFFYIMSRMFRKKV